jgi:hypothetical protein
MQVSIKGGARERLPAHMLFRRNRVTITFRNLLFEK